MKKEYDTSVKEAIERVMSVFSEYIKTTPYFDIVLNKIRSLPRIGFKAHFKITTVPNGSSAVWKNSGSKSTTL